MKDFELTDQVDVCMFCGACCVDKEIDLSTTPGGDYVHLGGKIGKQAVCEACLADLKKLVAVAEKKTSTAKKK